MPLKNFIKENFVLVVGLTLPVLLIVLFFVASVLPKSMAVPPQYEMLFTEASYDNQSSSPYNVEFVVKDNALKARVWTNNVPGGGVAKKKLMAFDGKSQTVREIPYDLSKVGNVPNQTEISLPELRTLKVDASHKAPDGYEFDDGGYGSGGMVTELFGGGGYRSNMPRITKGATAFKIPNEHNNNYYYYNIQFIGWLLK